MSFKAKIFYIKDQLEIMEKESPYNCMGKCVDRKLNMSLEKYLDSVERTTKYLLSRSSYKVLKAISKRKEKEEE